MLLQAEGDGSSAAGTRLQRLSTELVAPCRLLACPPRRSCFAPALAAAVCDCHLFYFCCCLAHTPRGRLGMPGKAGPGATGPRQALPAV